MEHYGFEYSDEEPEEKNIVIENQYYHSKGLVETDPEGALSGFAKVVSMEQEKAEWQTSKESGSKDHIIQSKSPLQHQKRRRKKHAHFTP
ncbi:hypothetical protein K2173_017437 [Erythroxylum novogranatense]|uniref:Uncharacterized protein n=1 Tax=Erythroxylum novogranatense TaxID=1862640 RepID=A0AAV8TMG1_9ROSI|nr:hypothetical protein K2173_017437 [Erythroxylum novogranatense]